MALINCPECGKEISDKAKQCVYCGYPINESTNDLITKRIIIICVSLVVVVGLVFALTNAKRENFMQDESNNEVSEDTALDGSIDIITNDVIMPYIKLPSTMYVLQYADLNNYPIVYDADVIQNLDLNLSNVGTIYIQDSILGYTEYDVPCQMLIDVDELCRKENKNNGTGGNAAKYNGTIKVQVVTKERADLLIEGGMMKDDFFFYLG